jgi:uncharacterized protein YqhQ
MAKEKKFYYGGQAVIEGVLMRGKKALAIAIRQTNGDIKVTDQSISAGIYQRNIKGVPFFRGVFLLIETMVLGIQALFYSAQAAASDQLEEEISPGMLWGTAIISIVIGVAIFFVGPLLLTNFFIYPYVESSVLANLIEGVFRIIIFVIYLKLISYMSDIRAVFAYHGAEHKAVNAYEAGIDLEVGAVKKYSTAHTRCGTSFLLIVMVLAIVVFSMLGKPPLWWGITSRIVLIPVIAAVGYEIVRFAANYSDNRLVRAILWPGLALQTLTTREPTDKQLEVALAALRRVVAIDRGEVVPGNSATSM